jgi:hypothetical protein
MTPRESGAATPARIDAFWRWLLLNVRPFDPSGGWVEHLWRRETGPTDTQIEIESMDEGGVRFRTRGGQFAGALSKAEFFALLPPIEAYIAGDLSEKHLLDQSSLALFAVSLLKAAEENAEGDGADVRWDAWA